MSDAPLDLSPLDPDDDPERARRVVAGAMSRLDGVRAADRGAPNRIAWAASLAGALLLGVWAGWSLHGVAPGGAVPGSGTEAASAAPVALTSVFDDMDVSADQRARIRAVIDRRDPSSDELLAAVARELDRIVASRDEEIRQVLDPGQRSIYERRMTEAPVLGFRREYRTERARVILEAMFDPNR